MPTPDIYAVITIVIAVVSLAVAVYGMLGQVRKDYVELIEKKVVDLTQQVEECHKSRDDLKDENMDLLRTFYQTNKPVR